MQINHDLVRSGIIPRSSKKPRNYTAESSSATTPERQSPVSRYRNFYFEQSKTLQSVQMSKDSMVSSQNVLKTPIEYNIENLKSYKNDTSKLICAVRNFYRHQEAIDELEQAQNPTEGNQNVKARRQIKTQLQQYPFQVDKEVKKDLWRVKFLQRSQTSDKIREMELQKEKIRLSTFLDQKLSTLHEGKAQKVRRAVQQLDEEFIKQQFKRNVKMGSRLSNENRSKRAKLVFDRDLLSVAPSPTLNPCLVRKLSKKQEQASLQESELIKNLKKPFKLAKTQSLIQLEDTPVNAMEQKERQINLQIPMEKKRPEGLTDTDTGQEMQVSKQGSEVTQDLKLLNMDTTSFFLKARQKRSNTADGKARLHQRLSQQGQFINQTSPQTLKAQDTKFVPKQQQNFSNDSQPFMFKAGLDQMSPVGEVITPRIPSVAASGRLNKTKQEANLDQTAQQSLHQSLIEKMNRRKFAQIALKKTILRQIYNCQKEAQQQKRKQDKYEQAQLPWKRLVQETSNDESQNNMIKIEGFQAKMVIKPKILSRTATQGFLQYKMDTDTLETCFHQGTKEIEQTIQAPISLKFQRSLSRRQILTHSRQPSVFANSITESTQTDPQFIHKMGNKLQGSISQQNFAQTDSSQSRFNLPLKQKVRAKKPPIQIKRSIKKLKQATVLREAKPYKLVFDGKRSTIDMGTQAAYNEQEIVMPEIMGFDQDCLIPNESFGEDLSPLQRKINLEGDLSVTDLN